MDSKRIYLVRHCQATGQEPQATLTDEGLRQSYQLAEFFHNKQIDYIVSSPYQRAIDSIKPLSELTGLHIHLDRRLQERVLSAVPLQNWMKHYEETFRDIHLKFEGGESSYEAAERGMEAMREVINKPVKTALLVSHGALLSLIIRQYDRQFGFEEWKQLSNPDVYLLEIVNDRSTVRRVWR